MEQRAECIKEASLLNILGRNIWGRANSICKECSPDGQGSGMTPKLPHFSLGHHWLLESFLPPFLTPSPSSPKSPDFRNKSQDGRLSVSYFSWGFTKLNTLSRWIQKEDLVASAEMLIFKKHKGPQKGQSPFPMVGSLQKCEGVRKRTREEMGTISSFSELLDLGHYIHFQTKTMRLLILAIRFSLLQAVQNGLANQSA